LFVKNKKGNTIVLALYGVFCFIFLYSYYKLPEKLLDPYLFLYTTLEYAFFTSLLYSNIQSRNVKKLILGLSAIFILFQIVSYFKATIGRLDTVSIGIETILLFIYVILLFSEYFRNSKSVFIYNNHFFWIALGILIYLGGTFFFNISANLISREQLVQYLKLTYVLEMIKTSLFAVALIMSSLSGKKKELTQNHIPYLDLDMN